MNGVKSNLITAAACAFLSASVVAPSFAQLPSDVRSNHWASVAVEQILASKVMNLQEDHQFHGEGHVSRREAAIALATLAKQLETGAWKPQAAKAVPDKVAVTLSQKGWESKSITRFEMASVLARFANYFVKAVNRAPAGSKDVSKSNALPEPIKITLPTTNPAYTSLKYLADGRMIRTNSPLLTADSTLIKASELSKGLSEMAAGLIDRVTELGLDKEGNTPDSSFHRSDKKPTTPTNKNR